MSKKQKLLALTQRQQALVNTAKAPIEESESER